MSSVVCGYKQLICGECFFPAVYQNLHQAAEMGQMGRVMYFVKNGAGVNIKDTTEVCENVLN